MTTTRSSTLTTPSKPSRKLGQRLKAPSKTPKLVRLILEMVRTSHVNRPMRAKTAKTTWERQRSKALKFQTVITIIK